MEFIDLDDDISDDPIKDFLKNKLDEIKAENVKMRGIFEELKEETMKFLNQIEDVSEEISIEKSWVKIVHDKYAIWFLVKNKTEGLLKQCRLILSWNSSTPLSYTSSMFSIPISKSDFNRSFQCIDVIEKEAYIVAIIDCPEFLEKRCFNISGMFTCVRGGRELHVDIPGVSIASNDLTDREKIVPIYRLIESHIPDLVSTLAGSNKIALVLKISDCSRDVFSILEIDASLYRVSFTASDVGRFFLCHKISPIFDGCILEVFNKEPTGVSKIVLYYRDQTSLLALVHHLHQNISSLICIPKEYETRLHSKSVDECEEHLKMCILEEIDFAKKFARKTEGNKEELKKFKTELCDIEYETDKAYENLRIAKDRTEEEET